jgi:[ribosomal protein S18]-alanine N-acetyltransferase
MIQEQSGTQPTAGPTAGPVGMAQMDPADLAEVLLIETDLFGPERWTRGMFLSEIAQGHYYVVARGEDGRLLGYAGLAVTVPEEEAWVNNLAVRPDAQRRGIGRTLLEALLAEAARCHVTRILLEVAADNVPAQQLYAAYGFERIGLRRGYYQPSNTDALVMSRG